MTTKYERQKQNEILNKSDRKQTFKLFLICLGLLTIKGLGIQANQS